MIDSIQGKLTKKTPTHVIVETHGIGFRCEIPLSSYETLGDEGENVKVLTILQPREDAIQLFGFATEKERGLFRMLISVTGIGPRSAQSILSGISVDEFKTAILDHDLEILTKAPGVGKKTAERLVLELKEKIEDRPPDSRMTVSQRYTQAAEEAVLALVSLGYKRPRVQDVIKKLVSENTDRSVEELVRLALQRL